MKTTLEKRILIFSFLVLTVSITVNTACNIDSFRRSYRDGVLLRINGLLASLTAAVQTNQTAGVPLAGMAGLGERCAQILRSDSEIAYCLIEDEVGRPLFGHSALPLAQAEAVGSLDETATVLDLPLLGRVFDVSVPLLAADGLLLGRARMGFPERLLKERSRPMLHQSLLVLGVGLLAVLAMVVFFANRHLIRPIRRLCAVSGEIAAGNFQVPVPVMPTEEFAALGGALKEMAISLQQREEAVQEGYRLLEQANLLLQQTHLEQERTGAELARSQKMHLALFENASDAILISDQDDRITLFNRQAEEFFGISRTRMIGLSLFRALENVRVDSQAQHRFHRQLQQAGRHEGEFAYVRASDFEPVIGWVTGSVARDRNGASWTQLIVRDVTRERRVKENLEKATREMERLNQMKNSFLGLASHELKTPLTVIVGYADLILSGGAGKVEAPVQEMVRYIAEAADRLTGVVRDMVDVSLLDGRRLPLEVRPVDINDLVRQVVAENGPFLSQRGHRVELNLEADLPAAPGDGGRLKQALAQLFGNAIKFTPDGGLVAVETRVYANPLRPDLSGEEKVEIVIRDTGIGIAEGDRLYVFDKFFEGGEIEEHFTGKVAFRGRGTGLGLTIAKGIVELHGGRIWVESPGHDPAACPGSTFHVLLPVSPPAAPS